MSVRTFHNRTFGGRFFGGAAALGGALAAGEDYVSLGYEYADFQGKAPKHRVYTKVAWNDDWTIRPHLFATHVRWALAPDLGAASLEWRYGLGMRRGDNAFVEVPPDDGAMRYVKIEIDRTDADRFPELDLPPRIWVGVLGTVQDDRRGEFGQQVVQSCGKQTLSAVSLEKVLADKIVRFGRWRDAEGETHVVDFAPEFNPSRADGGPGANRGQIPVDGAYCFSNRVGDEDQHWKTIEIVDYLLIHYGVDALPITLDVDDRFTLMLLSDRPSLAAEGRSIRELLNVLLAPQRMLSWYLQVGADDAIKLRIVSLTGTLLDLPEGLLMGSRRKTWVNLERDHGATLDRVYSHLDAVDRVRIRGARATTTFTAYSPQLVAGWKDADETTYETAASSQAGYAALSTDEKQRRNAEVRNRDALATVFARIALDEEWDGTTPGGANVFPNVYTTADFQFNPRDVRLLPTLPLRDGYDYLEESGRLVATKRTDGPHNARPPLVAFEIPGSSPTRYVAADKVGQLNTGKRSSGEPDYSWSAHVRVPRHDRAIMVDVHYRPQWIIAGDDFTPLAVEESEAQDRWDWKDARFTICVEQPIYCEGVWPTVEPATDVIREAVLYAPATFRLDRVCSGTVLDVQPDGSLLTVSGTYWLNDDREKLQSRAKLAFAWYGVPKTSLSFSTRHLTDDLSIGDFITTVNTRDPLAVNCVISSVAITLPGEGSTELGRVTYETNYYAFDVAADFQLEQG